MSHPYAIVKPLGEGAFGRVSLAKHEQTQTHVALKEPKGKGSLQQEQEILEYIRKHSGIPGIPHLIDIHRERGKCSLIVTEYIEGQTLAEFSKQSVAYPIAIDSITQLFTILARLHKLFIVHNDLHDENVMLSSGRQVFVLDLGVAEIVKEPTSLAFSRDIYATLKLARQLMEMVTERTCKRVECIETWIKQACFNDAMWRDVNAEALLIKWQAMLHSLTPFPHSITIKHFGGSLRSSQVLTRTLSR